MTVFEPGPNLQNEPKFNLKEFGPDFRNLTAAEIDLLQDNRNQAQDWSRIFIVDDFDASLIYNNYFSGTIYLESISNGTLHYDDLSIRLGISNSHIESCYIGAHCAIHNVSILSYYLVEENSILQNIQQLTANPKSIFDSGLKADNDHRYWIEVANENGGRAILPFAKMIPADAYLWSHFGHNPKLKQRLIQFTDNQSGQSGDDFRRIGKHTIIMNCTTLNNINVGQYCSILGAQNLDNLTILSNQEEPTYIGSGTDLRNGIIGFQNKIDSNTIAENFMSGKNVTLKYGAKLIHSFVGDNSNIACAEVLNNLIFPFHEQHHNNSFLIASTLLGQSNIAAGATIGSNHNSRAADGEIIANRGFWPGLVSNFKHNSKFASFTLAAKGNYDNELNITLPFSLISPAVNPANIRIFPGFWFKYNLYALARNSWKFKQRDHRKNIVQVIETDFLAPDTAEEMMHGLNLLLSKLNELMGQTLTLATLKEEQNVIDKDQVLMLDNQVNKGVAEIYKPAQAILLYRDMILFYSISILIDQFPIELSAEPSNGQTDWINLGGQIISGSDMNNILDGILSGQLSSWEAIHNRYAELDANYSKSKHKHALFTLQRLVKMEQRSLDSEGIRHLLDDFQRICKWLISRAFESRNKDYESSYRKMVYKNEQEMETVLGKIEDNPFLAEYEKMMHSFIQKAEIQKTKID